MAEFIDIILKSNTLNFLIVVLVLSFIFYKLNLKQKLENLQKDIKEYVDNSTDEKELAQKELLKSQADIEKLPADINKIKKDTDNSLKNLENKVYNETEEQKQDIANNAQRLLNLETKKFYSKLINILSEKSVDLAKENAIEQLNQNKDLHKIYIDEAINELDKINL